MLQNLLCTGKLGPSQSQAGILAHCLLHVHLKDIFLCVADLVKRCNCVCPAETVRLLLVLRLTEASANDVGNPAKGDAQHEKDAHFAREWLKRLSSHLIDICIYITYGVTSDCKCSPAHTPSLSLPLAQQRTRSPWSRLLLKSLLPLQLHDTSLLAGQTRWSAKLHDTVAAALLRQVLT